MYSRFGGSDGSDAGSVRSSHYYIGLSRQGGSKLESTLVYYLLPLLH
jgi:hypothetical protein